VIKVQRREWEPTMKKKKRVMEMIGGDKGKITILPILLVENA
jgi:hypothetical protein